MWLIRTDTIEQFYSGTLPTTFAVGVSRNRPWVARQEQFARPAPEQLNGLYADSSRMQAVVHEQLGNLQRGKADCAQIIKTIKSVDYPVE